MGAKKERKDKSEIGLKINAATSKFTIMMIINGPATLQYPMAYSPCSTLPAPYSTIFPASRSRCLLHLTATEYA